MSKKKLELAVYISAVMLVVGVFLPLTKLPIYGDVSYHRVAAIESYMVITFALTAPILLFTKNIKLIGILPVGIWLALLLPAIKSLFQSKDSGFFGEVGDKASSVMTEFSADLFLNIAEFSWGGVIFILGLLGFTASCVMRSMK